MYEENDQIFLISDPKKGKAGIFVDPRGAISISNGNGIIILGALDAPAMRRLAAGLVEAAQEKDAVDAKVQQDIDRQLDGIFAGEN